MNKQDELRIRLEFLIPLKWMDDLNKIKEKDLEEGKKERDKLISKLKSTKLNSGNT